MRSSGNYGVCEGRALDACVVGEPTLTRLALAMLNVRWKALNVSSPSDSDRPHSLQ